MVRQYDSETLERLKAAELEIFKAITEVCAKYDIGYFMIYGTLIGAVRHKGFIPWDDDMDIAMFRKDYNKFVKVFEKEKGDKYSIATPLTQKGFASTVIKVQKKGTRFVPEHSRKMKSELGICVDIFVFDKVSNNPKQYEKQKKRTRLLSQLIFLIGSPSPEIKLGGGIKEKMAKVICASVHYLFKLWPGAHISMYKKFVKYSLMANTEKTSKYTTYQETKPDNSIADVRDILPYKQMEFENVMVNVPCNYDYILRNVYGDYMKIPPVEERVNHAAYLIDFGD